MEKFMGALYITFYVLAATFSGMVTGALLGWAFTLMAASPILTTVGGILGGGVTMALGLFLLKRGE